MSRWTDDYRNQPFHSEWSAFKTALAAGKVPEDGELVATVELARLRKIVEYIDGLLDGIDPELVNPALLPNLLQGVRAMQSETGNFFVNGNINHLVNANANADQSTLILAQNVATPFGMTSIAMSAVAITYQEAMIDYAKTYSAIMLSKSEASERRISKLDDRLIKSNEDMTKFDDRITKMETELPTLLSGFNTTFQASESQRLERYDRALDGNQIKFDKQFADTAGKQGAAILVLESYQEQAGKVLGSVVDTAQAGAYATYANEQKQSANLYRRLALSLMVVAALVLFIPEISAFAKAVSGYAVDWQKALYRLPFSLILFAPALYLAKESSKHRINEVLNRRRQHILTTIGPYLALLKEDQADEIRAEVAKSIFSDGPQGGDDKSEDASNMISQVTNLVTTIFRHKP